MCRYANDLISQIILSSQSYNLQSVAFGQHFEHANMVTLHTVKSNVILNTVVHSTVVVSIWVFILFKVTHISEGQRLTSF